MDNEKLNEQTCERGAEYRMTMHVGDGVFSNDLNARSLTREEAKAELLRRKNELLEAINSSDDYPRQTRKS